MTEDEVIDLLTAAAMFDRRTVGEADAEAWLAVVGDLPFTDALAAVRAHYTDSTDWLMPAHVRARVRAMRRDRLERTPLPAPAPELDPVRYRQSLLASIAALADGRQLRRAIAAPAASGLPAGEAAALKAALGAGAAKLSPQELAAEQAAESRAQRLAADRESEAP